jgi:hypothetical protein
MNAQRISLRVALTVVLTAAACSTGSPVAQANPDIAMGVIEASAAQLCAAVDADPSAHGVMAGLAALDGRDLDDVDATLVLITAVHHVCPNHEDLVMGALEPVAVDELCPKRSWA